MKRQLSSDLLGGLLVGLFGVFVTGYAATTLQVGMLRRMGPGFMPLCFGIVLIVVGLALMAQSWGPAEDPGDGERGGRFDLRATMLISASLVAFSLLMRFAGLVPAAFAVTFIGALADRGNSLRAALLVGLAIAAVSIVVFWWLLSVQIPLFRTL